MTNTRAQYDSLGTTYLIVAGIVFVIVAVAFAFVLIRYRAGRDPTRAPGETDKHTLAEVAYVVVLIGVTAFLVTITFQALSREDGITRAAASSPHSLRIRVVAAQWTWRFQYEGKPVVTIPPPENKPTPLYVPVGRPILFTGRSQDVLHQFWVPDVRFKRQIWPDHDEQWGMVFPNAGVFEGVCNWFCGLWHQNMRFDVIALPGQRFDRWLAAQRRKAAR